MAKKKAKQGTDPRYKVLINLIEANEIASFESIFINRYITQTVVAEDSGVPQSTLSRKIGQVGTLTLDEMERLSVAIGIDFNKFVTFLRKTK